MSIKNLIDEIVNRQDLLILKLRASEKNYRDAINNNKSLDRIDALGNEIANYKDQIHFLDSLVGGV
jgi:hypothetical protein